MKKTCIYLILAILFILKSDYTALAKYDLKQMLTDKSAPIDFSYVIKPQIVGLADGDTIKIRLYERDVYVRLTGIDCYETSANRHIKYQRNQGLTDDEIISKGLKGKEELLKILRANKDIYLELTSIDRYSRLVGIFYYKDANGNYVNINRLMKNTGYCPEYIYKRK